jgi:oligopeptide transport system permease protein
MDNKTSSFFECREASMTLTTDELFAPRPAPEDRGLHGTIPGLSFREEAWRRFKKNKMAMAGLCILFLLLFMAIVGPWLTPYEYYQIHLEQKNSPPSTEFWFGSDDLGRDIFTRIWYGARISLFVGVAAALLDVIVGVLWGGIAGLAGGRLDEAMMRVADLLHGLPYLLIVILLIVITGTGLLPIILALTVIGWIPMARMVRGQVLQLKNQEYVLAAHALGASFMRVLFRHLIPNAMGPIIVMMTMTVPVAIFAEAFLSFLGIGVQAPVASWGTMANDGVMAMQYYPWRLFFPAFFISITMLSFNMLGDGLRDALDPRMKK